MDIKKLGLISTVSMLSVTVSLLGGCDLLKSEEEIKMESEREFAYKSAEYVKNVAELRNIPKTDKSYAKLDKARDELNKARDGYRKVMG